MMRQEIEKLSEQGKAVFEACSDSIWSTPELNFTEHKSCEASKKVMEELGFKITWPLEDMDTAFIAEAGHGKPVIGLLGEIDALPGLSAKADTVPFEPVTEGGNGHGCGHNLLGCGAMEAAWLIKNYLEEHHLEGTVKYFCCPAEEGGVGKYFMIERGAFDDVDFTVSWHPSSYFGISQSGKSIYIANFKFYGTAAHAAGDPYHGRSALDALELMNVGVQFLREHVEEGTNIHYAITNSGGRAANVVQSYAEASYVVRALDNSKLRDVFRRVCLVATGAATMTETRFDGPEIVSAISSIVPNEVMSDVLRENIKSILPVEYTPEELEYAKKFQAVGTKPDAEDVIDQRIVENVPASTDVGDVSWVTPLVYLRCPTIANGTPGHSWQITAQGKGCVAKKGMHIAARLMANTCLDMVEKPELIDAAKADFKKKLAGRTYAQECLMPKDRKPTPIY